MLVRVPAVRFEHKYLILVICEPNIPHNLRLSVYEVLHSVRRCVLSGFMIPMRAERTYVVLSMQPNNENVCVTIKGLNHYSPSLALNYRETQFLVWYT